MKCALIGYGYWGRNLAKTIDSAEGIELFSIFDTDSARLEDAAKLYKFRTFPSYEDVLKSDCEAVFIATPPDSHYEIALEALIANKHIFVEKPLTTNIEQAFELYELAEQKGLTILVDHIFVYSEAVKYINSIKRELGEVVYINSRRINLGLFQHTVDVIWDLAVHDFSIIDYLFRLDIKRVTAFKNRYKNFENSAIANIDLELMSGIIVNINVSWLSPVKIRDMVIGGTELTVVYDDIKHDKINLFDAGVILKEEMGKNELYSKMVQYNYGNIRVPEISKNLPLDNAVKDFSRCIRENNKPAVSKEHVLRVIKALEIVTKI
jgi:predicted dehydrogenase